MNVQIKFNLGLDLIFFPAVLWNQDFGKAVEDEIPESAQEGEALGRYLNGCRIRFDGKLDRKCTALIGGNPDWRKDA